MGTTSEQYDSQLEKEQLLYDPYFFKQNPTTNHQQTPPSFNEQNKSNEKV